MQTRPIVSLQARILQQQAAFPEATGKTCRASSRSRCDFERDPAAHLGGREGVSIVASEENEEPVILGGADEVDEVAARL